jgi:hypothetical protein
LLLHSFGLVDQVQASDKQKKREFGELRRAIASVLRRHDPVGLISMGAPDDEYDPEVGTILPRMRDATSELNMVRILHEEFVRWFGHDQAGTVTSYEAPAREIWEHWLLSRARQLSGSTDVELVDPGSTPVLYLHQPLAVRRVLRAGPRFFVESTAEPNCWWMGALESDGCIHVWGEYGSHEEAFPQH